MIRLSAEAEPEIYRTTHTFGTILENVTVDERGVVDLDDDSKTENTRAAYELEQIPNAHPSKMAGHPRNVVFLTADAFGILPPHRAALARAGAVLVPLGVHGEARGDRDRRHGAAADVLDLLRAAVPAPSRRPSTRRMLADKLAEHGATVWLVNTGWTGGPFGEGHRMPIDATRALLTPRSPAALDDAEYRVDPVFGFEVPVAVPGVDAALLDPRSTWARPGGVRREGRRARGDVPRELRAVRRRRRARGRRRRPARA